MGNIVRPCLKEKEPCRKRGLRGSSTDSAVSQHAPRLHSRARPLASHGERNDRGCSLPSQRLSRTAGPRAAVMDTLLPGRQEAGLKRSQIGALANRKARPTVKTRSG